MIFMVSSATESFQVKISSKRVKPNSCFLSIDGQFGIR